MSGQEPTLLTQKVLVLLLITLLWLATLGCCTTVCLMQPDFASGAAVVGLFLCFCFFGLFTLALRVRE